MSLYTPPSIKTIRDATQSSVVLSGGEVVPSLIGTALGKTSNVLGYEAALAASATYTIPDLRPSGPPTAISAIRSLLQGGVRYEDAIDYVFDDDAQTIAWQSVALSAPYITTIADVASSSSDLDPETTYYYVVTAIRPLNLTGPVLGETVASNEISGQQLTSTSRLKLTWRPVPGATAYKIYRSEVSGVYTGSALLATVASGFTNTYTDDGTATAAGSPPGVETSARVVAGSDTPNQIAAAAVFAIDVDGVTKTATLNGTAPSLTGTGITYPLTITNTVNDALVFKVTDKDGTHTTTVDLTAGSRTLAQIIDDINNTPFQRGVASNNGGQLKIAAQSPGSDIIIEVVSGNGVDDVGLTVTSATGTGDLPDFNNVETQDLVDGVDEIVGATLSVDSATGRLAVTHDTPGTAHTLQPKASANTLLGFATTLVTGSDATAGTALRRPALNGGAFFVDYQFVAFDHFNAKRFTSLPLLIAEYGRGSRLAIGGTLAMGTSGQGNGASQVVAMSVPDDELESYEAALDLLRKRKDVTLVVPLTVVDGIHSSTKAHCLEVSDVTHKRERRAVLGTAIGTVVGDEDTADTVVYLARQAANERVILVHPWPFVNVQDAAGEVAETELDGWASAAAVAGRIASLPDRATSPTCKTLNGISRLGVELDETDEDTLGGAGVCVLTTENGNIVVRDGLTTSLEDEAQSRIQIGLTDDLLRQTLRAQFRQFRGQKLVPNLLKQVRLRTIRVLTIFKKLELIADFDAASVSVIQDPDVLTNVVVRFSYKPMFDVKVIEFRYSLDLTPVSIAA